MARNQHPPPQNGPSPQGPSPQVPPPPQHGQNLNVSGVNGPAFAGETSIGDNANFQYNNLVLQLQNNPIHATGPAHKRLERYALEFGFDFQKDNPRLRRNFITPAEIILHVCVVLGDIEVVKLLVEDGGEYEIYVDATLPNGWTPLHNAVLCGMVDVVSLLVFELDADVDKTTQDDDSLTALHIAARYDRAKIATVIGEANANVEAKSKSNLTPLHVAAIWGNAEVAAAIVKLNANQYAATAPRNWTPMHWAAFKGHADALREIARVSGTDVNVKAVDGWTPLHLAAAAGHTKAVGVLVMLHAKVNAKDENGLTPLSLAKMKGHKEVARVLKHHGGVVRSIRDTFRT
ncbi:ankyrin repeat-containing domain protein [Jimgerdemannia flammicorona]|uniref:Ankyrin repeat-containing domain protein n=1 Tax=Jimgerdemannia flammicorona TaxID=994334 RepID=A0A433QSK4_9FUNG|nr:ankyrin repeat-containing domain protein [Jimgerdemannia flammicorona]